MAMLLSFLLFYPLPPPGKRGIKRTHQKVTYCKLKLHNNSNLMQQGNHLQQSQLYTHHNLLWRYQTYCTNHSETKMQQNNIIHLIFFFNF